MVDSLLLADYQSLDIDPKASLLEVERAFFHLRSLYVDGSLATYGLLEQPQKKQRLQEIEAAYARIIAARQQLARPILSGQEEDLRLAPAYDSPAGQLRQARIRRN